MKIVNPTFGLSNEEHEELKGGPVDWKSDPIALFDNSKPNARELLAGIRDRLAGERRVDNVEFLSKPSASTPAPPELIEKIAKDHRLALLALAD